MAQHVTPELKAWIVQQARAGCTPESVLQAMRAAGWEEAVALDAMEDALEGFVRTLPQPVPPAAPVRPIWSWMDRRAPSTWATVSSPST